MMLSFCTLSINPSVRDYGSKGSWQVAGAARVRVKQKHCPAGDRLSALIAWATIAIATVMVFYSSDNFMPDCSIGYLVRRAHQIGQGKLDPVFAEEGMTGTQWSAMVSIWVGRAATCAELARDLAHDKGATTRMVDQLEERGWLTRDRDVDDRRFINLALTPTGEAVALKCRERVIACWNAWLADWDRGEIETLIALLAKLRTTLDDVDEAPCD